ncbi:CBS domain-containing protein [Candidatus Bathyarchaeota archaeon]|nr:MAG: CBS domain-containing protein [Candidatus Bathyarchaeota archaeon]
MRSPPVTALFSDSVSYVTEKMVSNNIGAVIIISGGRPSGIITERDTVEKIVRTRRDPDKTRAAEIMSSPLITIDSTKTVAEALKIMRDRKIRRLAVIKNGRLVGIVTERRLLDSLI